MKAWGCPNWPLTRASWLTLGPSVKKNFHTAHVRTKGLKTSNCWFMKSAHDSMPASKKFMLAMDCLLMKLKFAPFETHWTHWLPPLIPRVPSKLSIARCKRQQQICNIRLSPGLRHPRRYQKGVVRKYHQARSQSSWVNSTDSKQGKQRKMSTWPVVMKHRSRIKRELSVLCAELPSHLQKWQRNSNGKRERKENFSADCTAFCWFACDVALRWLVYVTCVNVGVRSVDLVPRMSQCTRVVVVSKAYRHCTLNKKEKKRRKENQNDAFLSVLVCSLHILEKTTGFSY